MAEQDRFDELTEFKPFYDKQTTERLLNAYKFKPHTFKPELVSQLKDHAIHHKLEIPEPPTGSPRDSDFNLMRGIKQMGQGFVSGFTTFNVGEPTDNEYERIMRSLGSLGGFLGYIPSAPFKALGARQLANMARALKGNSVPLYLSKKATEKVGPVVAKTLETSKAAKNDSFKTALDFLTTDNAKHVAEGAFNLGLASSIGSWQLGVNEMLKSGLHGAVTGGAFRGFANLINKGGIPKLDQETGRYVYTATQQEDRLVRAVASSLYDGLQSTYRGETTPEQIYSYLLGAYFGANETTAGQARAMAFTAKVEKRAQSNAKELKRLDKDGNPYDKDLAVYDPRLEPGWDDLPKDVQESVMHTIAMRHGTFAAQAAMAGETLEGIKKAVDTDLAINEATDAVRESQIAEEMTKISKDVENPDTVTPEYMKKSKDKIFLTEGRSRILKAEDGESYPLAVDPKEDNVVKLPLKGMNDVNLEINAKLINDALAQIGDDARKVVIPKDVMNRLDDNAPETAQHLRKKLADIAIARSKAVENLVDKSAIEKKSEANESLDDLDIGHTTEVELVKKSQAFINKYLKSAFENLTDPEEIGALKKEYKDKLINILGGNTQLKQYKPFMENVQKNFPEVFDKKDLSDLAEGDLRQLFIRQVQQRPSPHYSLQFFGGGDDRTSLIKIGPTGLNAKNNLKGVGDSVKTIELAYEDIMYQLTGQVPRDRAYMVLDHAITSRGKKIVEIELKKLNRKDNYVGYSGKNAKTAQDTANRLIGQGLKAADKDGYYYNGGKGDSGKMYFFKHHPDVDKLTSDNISKEIAKVKKVFKKYDKNAAKAYDALKAEFVKKYRDKKVGKNTFRSLGTLDEVNRYFDKSFLSNLKWDETLYSINPKNFEKGKNFIDWLAENSSIRDSKGFNKRNQIWMTDGFELDADYFKEIYSDMGGSIPVDNNKLKYRLFADPGKNADLTSNSPARLYTEITDGEILIEETTIDALNKTWGLPESGQNKSFIVDSSPQDGAFLGKMMFHKASKEASQWMRDNDVHMLVPESAAKEFGSRKIGELKVNKDLSVDFDYKGGSDYEMNLTAIKGSLSEKQTQHMLDPQQIPKQLMSSLIPHASKELPQETIDEFFDEIIGDRYIGEDVWNDRLQKALDTEIIGDNEQINILDNIDKLGLKNIIDAIKTPQHPDFVSKLYQRVLRSNVENLTREYESGEVSKAEYMEAVAEAKSFTSGINRMMEIYPDLAVFLHKDVRNYLQASMRNFVVNKVIRPKWDYSISTRMRGIDPWLRRKFDFLDLDMTPGQKGVVANRKRLMDEFGVENPDQLFMLDDMYRKVEYDVSDLLIGEKRLTLGDLWDNYRDKASVKEFFKTISLRVPMDSISGAHELAFAGFTGIKGHGGVFHPRTMRALGGADLDGDKAFVLFGMKQKYRDMYHSNKYEYRDENLQIKDNKEAPISNEGKAILKGFLNPKDKHEARILDLIKNGKEVTFQDLLTFTNDGGTFTDQAYKSFIGKFTPEGRKDIADKAVDGRDQLGPAVISKQILNSVYNAALKNGPKRYWLGKKHITPEQYEKLSDTLKKKYKADNRESLTVSPWGEDKTYEIFYEPRTNKKELDFSRELFRAEIGFGSDPLDELGLTGGTKFFDAGWHSLFKVDWNGNQKALQSKFSPNFHARQGLFQVYQGFNKGYFSRNWDQNRRWYAHEIKDFSNKIHLLNENQRGDMLARMVEILDPIDYSDDIAARVDLDLLNQRYEDFKQTSLELRAINDSFEGVDGGLLGRFSFESVKSPVTTKVIAEKLYNRDNRKVLIQNPAVYKDFFKGLGGQWESKKFNAYSFPWEHAKWFKSEDLYMQAVENAFNYRSNMVDRAYRQGTEFMQNDAMDRASAQQLIRAITLARNAGVNDEFIHHMAKFVDKTKEIDRAQKLKSVEASIDDYLTVTNVSPEGKVTLSRIFNVDPDIMPFMNQERIENRIANYKTKNKWGIEKGEEGRPLSPEESYLFDTMMMSTYHRGNNLAKYSDLKGLPSELKNIINPLLREIERSGSSTLFEKTGLNAAWTSDRAIRDFLKVYSEQFDYKTNEKLDIDIDQALDSDLKDPDIAKVAPKDVFESDVDAIIQARERYKEMGKTNLSDFERKMVDELIGHVNYYGKSIASAKNLNQITRALLRKNFDALGVEDYRVLNNFFQEMRDGTYWSQKGAITKDNVVELAKRHWMLFPKTVSREMMVKDFTIFEESGRFQNYKGEWRRGDIGTPTHTIENIQYVLGKVEAMALKADEDEKNALEVLLRDKTGYESLPEGIGQHIGEVVTAERALRSFKNKNKHKKDNQYYIKLKEYKASLAEAKDIAQWDKIQRKQFSVNKEGGTYPETGRQIANNINDALTQRAIETYSWIAGKHYKYDPELGKHIRDNSVEDPILEFVQKDSKGDIKYWNNNELLPIIDSNKFVKSILKKMKEGEPIGWGLGLDNLRKISRSIQIENLQEQVRMTEDVASKNLYKELITNLSLAKYHRTGQFKANDYHPQFIQDKKVARRAIEQAIKEVEARPGMSEKDKKIEIGKLILRYKSMAGEWIVNDVHESDLINGALQEIAEGRKGESFRYLEKDPVAGNMLSRSTDLPGWSRDLGSWDIYQKNLIDTYHRQIGQIISKKMLQEFNRKAIDTWNSPDQVVAWNNYIYDYITRAMGFPSKVPEAWMDGPMGDLMKIKGTPYSWFADNHVKDKINKIRKAIGMKDSELVPDNLQGVDEMDIRHWSNLEAKYQMATLLAHPKSAAGNIFGGTIHTIQATGWKNWRNARNPEYWRAQIAGKAAKFETKKDIEEWTIGHGVVPNFVLYEAGLNPSFKSGKYRRFLRDVEKLLKKDPMTKDENLISLAKKHQITEAAFQKAAWFMRYPERALRRDAFAAGYLQARELYGHANMDLNEPFLIEMAKKTVTATQFLYSAPYRPAFSATALGKVMTRFQTWAWNSVRFRNDVNREARLHGYRPGTMEYERFKRQTISDMFVLGMSNVFAYSLFETAMPQPYSWFQDTADWLFGNEQERDRAFFGNWPTAVAPLQMVTPPGLRLAPAVFSSMVNNDYSRLTDYYLWTMFPFGRIARDTKGIIDNPFYTIEKMSGIPYIQMSREMKKDVTPDE